MTLPAVASQRRRAGARARLARRGIRVAKDLGPCLLVPPLLLLQLPLLPLSDLLGRLLLLLGLFLVVVLQRQLLEPRDGVFLGDYPWRGFAA
jgi:hypothetical protein